MVDSAAQFINDRLYRGEITISEALDLMKNNNNELKPMEQIKKISDDDYNDLLMRTHEWIKSKSSVNLANHILTKSS